MSEKIRDLAVKVGTYNDNAGNEKGRWRNVGALMRGDDGGEYVLLDRTFSPAGVPNTDGRESVLISAFKIRSQGNGQQSGGQQSSGPPEPPPPGDNEIPF